MASIPYVVHKVVIGQFMVTENVFSSEAIR